MVSSKRRMTIPSVDPDYTKGGLAVPLAVDGLRPDLRQAQGADGRRPADGLRATLRRAQGERIQNGVPASGLAAAITTAAITAITTITTTAAAAAATTATAGQVGFDFGTSVQGPGVGADETQVGALAVLGDLRLE